MKIPNIDLKEIKRIHQKNFQDRLKLIDWHTDWLKKTPNKVWSSQQKDIIG